MLGKRRTEEEEEDLRWRLDLDLERKTKLPREEQHSHWYGDSDALDYDLWSDSVEDDLEQCFRTGEGICHKVDDQENYNDLFYSFAAPAPYAGDNEENWALSDILVTVHKLGEVTSSVGVVKEVHQDGSCSVALKSNKMEEILIAYHNEIKIIPPKVSDNVKIIGGEYRGVIGKLMDVERSEGEVLVDDSPNVLIPVEMDFIAKLAHV